MGEVVSIKVTTDKRCPNCDCPIHDVIDISGLTMSHKLALSLFVDKFTKGALQHGDLQPGKKWTKDMLEEAVDQLFYTVFELLEHL